MAAVGDPRLTGDDSFEIRELEKRDFDAGFFELLAQLTIAPTPGRDDFDARLELLRRVGGTCLVAVDTSRGCRVVGCITVLVEPKFIRNLALVAHIEDVAVDAECRGAGLGRRLIAAAVDVARCRGCYKAILDSSVENAPFYEKCGFYRKEIQLRMDL